MKEFFSRLRQEAQDAVDMVDIDISTLSELEIKNIIHDLAVHRIELEMQNEELQRANKELEDAKRRYVDLFEFAPISYLTLDRQYRITQANLTFIQLVDLPRERIITTAFTNFISPDFQDAFYLVLGRLKKTGEKQRFDLQLIHGDQGPLWVHVEMASHDTGQSYLVSISDMTHRKQAEQALKTSEAKFRDLFHVVVDPMFIHDMEGNFLEVNESACLTLGYSRQELVRMNVADIDAHFSEEQMMNAITELMQTGEILFEGMHKTRDNRQFPVEIHSRIIEFEGKKAILSLARDISRRKEAEQRYELLSNVTFEGILIHKGGLALDLNASCSRLTGYAREELIGKNLFTLIATPQDQEKARQNMMLHEVAPYDIKVRRKDGSVFDAELEARDIEHQGEQVRIVAIRDITERKRSEQALKESKETNQRLADATFEAIFFSENGICTNQNSTAERMFGYTLAEAIGKPGTDWIHLNYRGLVKHKMMSGSADPYEAVALRKDGSTFPCEIQAKTAIHDDRKVRITALRDITDRKRAEEALQRSEKRFRAMFEQAAAGIVTVIPNGYIIDVNQRFCQIMGYTKEELLRLSVDDLMWPEDSQQENCYLDEVNSQKRDSYHIEKRYRHKDGHPIWTNLSSNVIRDEQGNIHYAIGVVVDITDRKQAEEALRQSERNWRDSFDSLDDVMMIISADCIIEQINQHGLDLLGLPREQVIGQKCYTTLHGADRPEDYCPFHTTLHSHAVASTEHYEEAFGKYFSIKSSPICDDKGNIVKFVDLMRDITDSKQAEVSLKDALTEKEVLLQEIHHRVKNNMQTIASLLYKQQQHTDDEYARTILDDSIQRVKSMALIHEQIYRSKNLARINLAEYIQDFANRLFQTYRQKSSRISLTIHADEIYLPVDKSLPVALILNELITNALKYAFPDKQRGDMWIKIREHKHEIILIVGDNGVGVPENFDPEQTNTLGVYLVYNLATKQLGGSIDVHHSDPTEFMIRFKN